MTPQQIQRIANDAEALYDEFLNRGYDPSTVLNLVAGAMSGIIGAAIHDH